MPGKRRSTSQLTRDRRRIADLYLQGWLQADIAREVGMSQPTISLDIKALHRQWLAESLVDFGAAKAKELAKIDALERTYHTAWIRSCEDAETTRQEGSKAGVDKITKTAKGQAGDPRFLAGVQWCIERRCKIMGWDKPIKIAPTDPSGEREYQGLTDDERIARIAEIFDHARARNSAEAGDAQRPVQEEVS